MKKIILAIALVLMTSFAGAQVVTDVQRNSQGQPFIRFINHNSYPVSCWYQDQFNYITFAINSYSSSMYYPIYGNFRWQCQ